MLTSGLPYEGCCQPRGLAVGVRTVVAASIEASNVRQQGDPMADIARLREWIIDNSDHQD
jgi:hypothetical protein